ncbi:hypothetical protein B0T22DRAFT_60908 [Podospora appendiculata]|uniref:Uncharacterized protein n=1 Tax=Podospora appendiculata TaxID=314037 RepID=A0AAE0XIU7_9PEZI|nr:hypothetical protein B0T22DRAFT_60908 [Podospora appendiculata]
MAGGFSAIDPARCAHYAAFASHLGRRSFDAIYWILFVFVITMLFAASWQYSSDMEKVAGYNFGSSHYRNRMKRCMYICSVYSAVSVVAVVMEVFALLALQFCDGEDLMSLYWSTWTMMQVGALIAILGILLSVFNGLRGNKNPPWALALGTPVLVVAGLGHAFNGAMRKRVKRVRSRSASASGQRGLSFSSLYGMRGVSIGSVSEGRPRGVSVGSNNRSQSPRSRGISAVDLPMSREDTLQNEKEKEKENSEFRGTLIGYTPDGGPIFQFLDDPGQQLSPDRGSVIGRTSHNQVIVAFRKTMITISPDPDVIPELPERPRSVYEPRASVVRIADPPNDSVV